MHFALVTFPDEEDAPGVIPTNWIQPPGNSCLYPTVSNDYSRNKMVYSRQQPKSDWKECRVRVLKKYDTYETANSHLSEAELTSSIDSEHETNSLPSKRPRKERKITLPGEESTSSDEETTNPKKSLPEFPPPPLNDTTISTPSHPTNTPVTSHLQKRNTSSQKHHTKLQKHSTSQNQHSSQLRTPTPTHPTKPTIMRGLFSPSSSTTSPSSLLPPSHPLQVDVNMETFGRALEAPLSSSSSSGLSGLLPQQNQNMLWEVLGEFSAKLDKLIEAVAKIEERKCGCQEGNEKEQDGFSLANFPLEKENFLEFEAKLKDVSFRHKLARLLINIRGSSIKYLTTNLMRKLMSDDVAEEYSLTGKVTTGIPKKAFIKTETFILINEVCFKKFKDGEESKLREGISDWLMQAKFRKLRREKKVEKRGVDVEELM